MAWLASVRVGVEGAAMPLHLSISVLLSLLLSSSLLTVTVGACSNALGDAACAAQMALGDYCMLSTYYRLQCKQYCNAPTECAVPGDTDQGYDCAIQAPSCDNPALTYMDSYCPYTCALRDVVTCDPLTTLEGAWVKYNHQPPTTAEPRYMDLVTYHCLDGYLQTAGASSQAMRRACVSDGSWALDAPFNDPGLVCERVDCGAVPAAPALTSASRSTGVFEDNVLYTCAVGYVNTGLYQGNHTCNTSGLWQRMESDPVCTLAQCDTPPVITDATPSATSGSYLDTITYSCQAGFDNTGGTGHKKCDASEQWVPVGSEPDAVCTPKPCGLSQVVTDAEPSAASGSYRDIVTYSCVTGYSQSGGSTGERSCTVAGTWFQAQADPVCTIVSCGATPDVTACDKTLSSGTYGDLVTYNCTVGYSQSGGLTGQRTCSAAGTWDLVGGQSDPVCTIVSCGSSPTIADTQASLASGTYGNAVTYTCATGYSQSGGGTGRRTCSGTGLWDVDGGDTDPVCSRTTCGAPPVVVGATPSISIGYFPDNVTYTCQPGHDLIGGGSGRLMCNESAAWEKDFSDADPVCLGQFTIFINSMSEAQVAPAGSVTSTAARSNLHCASQCAVSVHCHGYTFTKQSNLCEMNTASRLPVISNMKKLYT